MPYIKKIELRNFKSFGLKNTTISLDKGFTAITGPNGSGKTNIVDAVLFGLGETSSRRLRADSFSKLIFKGNSDSKSKPRSARVVIQFDNSDGKIPIDTKTVTISRIVYANGQSEYLINGKKASRGRILEVLSIAGINPSGHNIVPQGTITKLTDISPSERRKIIEDLIGISLYNAEKAEAEEKLEKAENAINTAMGRVEEVQKRIDELERERNELLRYEFIKKDIRRLEALICSYKVRELENKIGDETKTAEGIQRELEELDRKRKRLKETRLSVEREWQKLTSKVVEEKRSELLNVQMRINEVKGRINELSDSVERYENLCQELSLTRQERSNKLQDLKRQIEESRERIEDLSEYVSTLSRDVQAKQSEYEALSSRIKEERSKVAEQSREVRELEERLNELYPKIVDKRDLINRKENRMQTLKEERDRTMELIERYSLNIEEMKSSLSELRKFMEEESSRLKEGENSIEKKLKKKNELMKALSEAEKIAELARESIIEFNSQRKLKDKIEETEKSLKHIEELAKLKVIKGVYGRLRSLIRVNKRYLKAVEAAADGWLNALVVKDYDAAFTCSEILKKLKLAKIKIIPLEGVEKSLPIKAPNEEGVIGLASDLVKVRKTYKPAVLFVFGDTLLTEDYKTAFHLSQSGYRAVTIDGEVFNPRGGLELGYYRSPIDLSKIIPSEKAVESLEKVVEALKTHLSNRRKYIDSIDEEIESIRVDIAKTSEVVRNIENESKRVEAKIAKTRENLRNLQDRVKDIEKEIEELQASKAVEDRELQDLERTFKGLQEKLESLRSGATSARIEEMENQASKILNELVKLKDELNDRQRELTIAKMNLENILKTSYEEAKADISRISSQLEELKTKIAEINEERKTLEPKLRELEAKKEGLMETVAKAKGEAEKFTSKIKEIDERLSEIENLYREKSEALNDLKLKIQRDELELKQQIQRLHELGFEKPMEVSVEQLSSAESSLKMMKKELEEIGAVNQLAYTQYEEQISRYKELSVRLNELEMEKQSIIEFMEEIEKRKKKAFMDAFNQINDSLAYYFGKLTGGGRAYMKLENPEDPFSGGVDMVVQFPNKPEILVSGASGGERSVASVAFLFAIQKLSPASFYLLDEVDAHLDSFHVAKLSELLVEESSKSQFLVITLKPEMASRAQKIYGVYERNGVSNIVSATIR
ncbi:chromosome segregation protein SMC [Candidatus Bathyarchaeota archaeon]|nr:chromosome segregation protein SMC [Candidatus Bathyarchaeota archaeon]